MYLKAHDPTRVENMRWAQQADLPQGSETCKRLARSSCCCSKRATIAGLMSLAMGTQGAHAAVPAVAPVGGSLTGQLNRALPFPLFPVSAPERIGYPRKQLDQRFAVLLMRSSYDAVDALDFIARQQFEVRCCASALLASTGCHGTHRWGRKG